MSSIYFESVKTKHTQYTDTLMNDHRYGSHDLHLGMRKPNPRGVPLPSPKSRFLANMGNLLFPTPNHMLLGYPAHPTHHVRLSRGGGWQLYQVGTTGVQRQIPPASAHPSCSYRHQYRLSSWKFSSKRCGKE